MKENKVVIEMNVSEFLRLRVLLSIIYQLIEEVQGFMNLARKYSSKFPRIGDVNVHLCHISDSLGSIKKEDLDLLLKLGSYSDKENK